MGFDRLWSIIRMRLRTLFDSRGADRDLDDELRFHLEQAAAQYESRGLSPEAASRAARLAIGGLEQRKEECRDRRGLARLGNLARDLRFALRLIARRASTLRPCSTSSRVRGLGPDRPGPHEFSD